MQGVNPDLLRNATRDLGDVLIDFSRWPEVLEEISKACGAAGAAILHSDARSPDPPRTKSIDELTDAYFRSVWHVHDLRAARGVPLLMKGAKVILDQDLVTAEEMRRAAYYNEVFIPAGFQWFAGIGFNAGSALWALCIQRTIKEGPFEVADKRLLAILSDQLSEVSTLSLAIGRVALSSATSALNEVHHAAIAIDRLGFVLDMNSAAAVALNDDIYVRNRRIFVSDPTARAALEKLLDGLRLTLDTEPLPTEPIVVRRQSGSPVTIRLLPVHGAARGLFLGARALLMFSPSPTKPPLSESMLMNAFDLTPAEARLSVLIADGVSLERAAKRLGVSIITSRNQLKSIFAKTETHRQGELIALLTKF